MLEQRGGGGEKRFPQQGRKGVGCGLRSRRRRRRKKAIEGSWSRKNLFIISLQELEKRKKEEVSQEKSRRAGRAPEVLQHEEKASEYFSSGEKTKRIGSHKKTRSVIFHLVTEGTGGRNGGGQSERRAGGGYRRCFG